MDKDRDISRSVTTITPKKVGFVGGAVLAGSALLAACGGGSKAGTGEVGGAQSNPTTGQTIEVKTAALPSATAVQEAPTATVEVQLTQEQITQIATNVENLITTGLSESTITLADLSKHHMASSYGNAASVSAAAKVCATTTLGDSFVDSNTGRTVTKTNPDDYYDMLLINCTTPGIASKGLHEITGNAKFLAANKAWEPFEKQMVEAITKVWPKTDWESIKALSVINSQ